MTPDVLVELMNQHRRKLTNIRIKSVKVGQIINDLIIGMSKLFFVILIHI